MNQDRMDQLTGHLCDIANAQTDDFLRDTPTPLDEDSGQFYLTVAEQQVFGIEDEYFN